MSVSKPALCFKWPKQILYYIFNKILIFEVEWAVMFVIDIIESELANTQFCMFVEI